MTKSLREIIDGRFGISSVPEELGPSNAIWDDGEWISLNEIDAQINQLKPNDSESQKMSINNYILVDFENIQSINLASLPNDKFAIRIFVGKSQNKIQFELVEQMQRFGELAEWIKIEGNGPNALDFHIAFTLGALTSVDCDANYFVISKDTGFDPLIETLKKNGMKCQRLKSIDEMKHKDQSIQLIKKTVQPKSKAEVIPPDNYALDVFRKLKNSPKPRSEKTLANAINALYNKSLTASQISSIISDMKSRKPITINQNKIEYSY
jgi:hypothetical protein